MIFLFLLQVTWQNACPQLYISTNLQNGRMPCDNVSALTSPLLLSTQFSLKGEKVILFLWYLTSSFVSEKLFTASTICWNYDFIECSCARVFYAQHRAALCCARSGKELPGELKELGRAESTHVLASLPVRFLMQEAWHPSVRSFKPGLYHPSLKEGEQSFPALPGHLELVGWGCLGWSHPGTSATADTAILCTAALQKEQGICRHTDHPLLPPFQPPLPLGCRDFPKALQRKTTRQQLERSAGNGPRQAAPHGLNWRKTKLPYCTAPNQSAELRGLLLRAHTLLSTFIFQGVARSSGEGLLLYSPAHCYVLTVLLCSVKITVRAKYLFFF